MFSGRSCRVAVNFRSWSPTQAEWTFAAQCVQGEEKERISKFMFKKDAKSAMVGRLLLRYAVSKILGIPCRALQFGRTEKGKPYLVSPIDKTTMRSDLSFNVSHQGDYVVLAAERGNNVGVDVMKVEWPRNTPVSSFFKTMHRQYTDQEWSEVKCYSNERDQLKVFFRLWCLKESVVKALGIGIGFEVSRLNFNFHCRDISEGQVVTDTTVDIDEDPAPEWSFEESFLDGHCIAVAVNHASKDCSHLSGDGDSCNLANQFQVMDIQEVLAGCEVLIGSVPDKDFWETFHIKEEEPKPS
ncbi:L-aminoadipate-semialdehyde dehydrogenase-phosphopantetheinyl transferase [Plakobranchus ocellatus]|uniref:L-aminoadipate-semialdehyde dehydrogenase-phosphopantetheinyl transferase n=1 Tax=Plakobranchus ocellatus TaxID=259542 RepID=A0AAV4AP60_9GAST|nr:L-aminoadipate-semialdehyde dehydrogenase-phosphopantetheinyl transferase [Plakobranchus ocellatus]